MNDLRLTSKQEVIKAGLNVLYNIGADQICKPCIASGGSCCIDCRFLQPGVGCQQRNTSCTAWLCGFLKYIFFESGLLLQWELFWDQVPGQDYREDYTPDHFDVITWLDSPNIRFLSKAFAQDLTELLQNRDLFWLLELKEQLDRYVDLWLDYTDPEIKRAIEKKMNALTNEFRHFHSVKEQWKRGLI
ncbi:hypothetical protein [Paenibacillus sp. GCM10027626]|uniref:hypothetical protein n=1 Tax=Paenibacillus sp. GCM10027626 TaxID=3273411 RepID=UPI00362B9773